jgi:hypothetical protein
MTCSITPANNTFSNTCPLLVHYEPESRIVPTTCANIVAGVYVAKPPVTNFAGVNLQNSTASHPLQNCRLYYSQIQMDPQHAITYDNSNTNKKVRYRTFVTNARQCIVSAELCYRRDILQARVARHRHRRYLFGIASCCSRDIASIAQVRDAFS